MTAIQRTIHASLETKTSHAQAALEGAALRGDLGIDAQLIAMSGLYLELRSEGKLEAAAAVKALAIAINESRN